MAAALPPTGTLLPNMRVVAFYSQVSITVNGGTVKGTAPLNNSYKAYGFHNNSSVIVNGGTVTAIGKNAFSQTGNIQAGELTIYAGENESSAEKKDSVPQDAKYVYITYPNTYYVHTPEGLSITQAGWNPSAGVITASADAKNFDPDKKIVITVTSPNNWYLVDTVVSHFNNDKIGYTLKANSTDVEFHVTVQ